MIGQAPQKPFIEGVTEVWFRATNRECDASALLYRPAVLIEYRINFRSLRAGLNHSEERSYTAWVPLDGLAIDWDTPALSFCEAPQLASQPDCDIGYQQGDFLTTKACFEQFEAELIDKLVRHERLCVFFNPVFGIFSAPGEAVEDFLVQVAEAALSRVEPELKRLRNTFELQHEQIREARSARGARSENPSFESFISRKLHLFESENRLAAMFSTLAGAVFGTTQQRHQPEDYNPDETELREDLDRVEHEASQALRTLYGEYLALASEYDIFEIGLQPDNIIVIRRALLWVPVSNSP